MELTGKCKEEFITYFHHNFKSDCDVMTGEDTAFLCGVYHDFIKLPKPFKYGVYVDYFDSVGIFINIIGNIFHSYEVFIDTNRVTHCKTRPEARDKAIEKANEIRNKQFE